MRLLITGAGGFVGGNLAQWLEQTTDWTLYGCVFAPPGHNPQIDGHAITQMRVDLRDESAVMAAVEQAAPDMVIHLAALADVARSFDNPWGTLSNNIQAQVNVLEAVRKLRRPVRVLVISSGEIYRDSPNGAPLDESQPFAPSSPYSVSKVAQDMLALQYHLAHDMPIVRARPFNHIGPGQQGGFVAADFASQIAAIEAGHREPVMQVGNLAAERDFTDVRDVVRAYVRLATEGRPGEAYNVCSGQAHSIQRLLDILLELSEVPIDVRQDPARMRPVDTPRRVGDSSKLRNELEWEPTIPFEQTLSDILDDWRARFRRRSD